MSNSPLIRTAVNLCLIAVMVIQPMAFVAARGTCAQGGSNGSCCQAKTVCHGCKSCEVETDGDLCGCCSGGKNDAGSCCTKNADAKPKHDDLFGEISDVVPEPPSADGQSADGESALSSCMCGVHSVPFAPVPNRAAVPQVRDLVVIAYLDHVATDAGKTIRPKALKSRLPIGDLSPHFSQRFLCIWRI
ncbi:hypothetical protein LF1_07610 [Rubripirellula obstinata]|uniref:Uncharacterized protein n=1 Tax=Rubripirellula obstinata TaxID=406547 RepID=A0A5B1CEF7_9BACT|nr:hypothetical protein [Rubripirellula obstinata]KAA1258245.1 hypothetical protein LF1_07610 [Rubripirellula obstinata]